MIKPDRWIRAWGESGGALPYSPEQVNAASYDVRLSDHWICPTRDPEEINRNAAKYLEEGIAAYKNGEVDLSIALLK